MGISVKTVEQHCTHLMEKLAIHDQVELAHLAIRGGIGGALRTTGPGSGEAGFMGHPQK